MASILDSFSIIEKFFGKNERKMDFILHNYSLRMLNLDY